ncbi:hypothetical protein GJ496_003399 [Pomphorhynchus laevis]|nr:hypothetical protein GJ496_003399 [Pomphorhynchus laevis]
MKVKILSRDPTDFMRQTKFDINRVPRNFDREQHPFEVQREYVRALNSVKLERLFAKPFIGDLSGHREGISALAKHRQRLSILLSGSYDGQVHIWDVMSRRSLGCVTAHDGIVRSIVAVSTDDETNQAFLSCGADNTIKEWHIQLQDQFTTELISNKCVPIFTVTSKHSLTGMDQHWSDCNKFITCGEKIELRERGRYEPLLSYKTGGDSHLCLKFNPIETNFAIASASDRSIIIIDFRQAVPVKKFTLEMCSSGLCWNPMEAYIFTAANDNHNLYTFDMRKLNRATNMHIGHVSAAMDVDYSPTGREFVSAGYDRTIRIFPTSSSQSRDVYYTKRMQRVLKVQWSLDSNYIFSGSDETDIRIWKANSSSKLGYTYPRERHSFAYQNKLKDKYSAFPKIKSIARHRHLPKSLYHAVKERHIVKQSQKRKITNRIIHSKPGTVEQIPERKQIIVHSDSD